MNLFKILISSIVLLSSCTNPTKYNNVTSSSDDILFYKLKEVAVYDNQTKISLFIPKEFSKVVASEERNVFRFTNYLEGEKTGYMISLNKLQSRNTTKLSDKQYLEIINKEFLTTLNGDLQEIEKILPPSMKNVKVIQFDGDLIINDKYFGRRISYYEDQGLVGTYLEGVNCTEFHFITIHNKTKYSLNIIYYGDDKSVSNVIGLFNTIGGSIKFE